MSQKITIKKLPKSLVQFEMKLNNELLEKWKPQAYKKISQDMKVPGFRPGHIPDDVVEKNHDEAYLQAHIIDAAFPHVYADIIKEYELKVIAPPEVNEKKDNPLVFEVKVAVMPEIKLGDYKKISIPKKKVSVTDKDIDKVIEDIKNRSATYKDIDRKAEKNNRAELDFEGFDTEGKPVENTKSKNHPLILGSNTMIPGFEDHIIGMKKDESKEFTLTFPKDYHQKSFQNKKVTFKTTLHRLEESSLPEIDEAFIEKTVGKKQSIKEFRNSVSQDLEKHMGQEIKTQRENELMTKIISLTELDIPDVMIQEELKYMLDQQKQNLEKQKIQWDHYLKHMNKTEEDLKKEMEPDAHNRIKLRVAFLKIMEEEKIEVSDKDIQEKIESFLVQVPKEHVDPFKKMYEKGSEGHNQILHQLKVDKVMEIFL